MSNRRQLLAALAAATAAVWLLFILPRRNPTPPRPPLVAPPPTKPTGGADLVEVARNIENSRNAIYGRLPMKDREEKAKMLRASKEDVLLMETLSDLAVDYLKFDQIEKSIATFDEALAIARRIKSESLVVILERAACAQLRRGEGDNCIAHHGPESCIAPLSPAAVHTDKTGGAAAKALLEEALAIHPDDPKLQWLHTVARMVLGETVELPSRLQPCAFPHFSNVAPKCGINELNHAGGTVIDDFDGDGLLDIITTSCVPDEAMRYRHNNGDGTYSDWTKRAKLDDQLGGLNLTHADCNNDGRLDLFVLRGAWLRLDGQMRNSLLRQNADGTFTDVTFAAGLALPAAPTQTAAWADFDLDGDLDVFVGNETMMDGGRVVFPSQLFRNNGDGTFTDVAAQVGIVNMGYCKGVAWGDYDNDGWPDLYLSNFGDENHLFHNERGRFVDVTERAGVAEPVSSFPCWFFDYDNDGRLDLFVGGYSMDQRKVAADLLGREHDGPRNRLYHNKGDGTFEDATKAAGLWRLDEPMGSNYGDLDNDGFPDIYLGTGYPTYDSIFPNVMYHNEGGARFADVTSAGFGHLQKGHGIAFADLDGNGDQDVFIEIGGFYVSDGQKNALFRNPGFGNRWLKVRLVGAKSNRFGIGARIKVVTDERTIYAVVNGGGSFGESPLTKEIGLGAANKIETLEVRWPGAGTHILHDVPLDATIEIREGKASFRRIR